MAQLQSPAELEEYRRELAAARAACELSVSVCAGAGCLASGAADVLAAFRRELADRGLDTRVETRGCGCPGFCERGPVVLLYPEEICYLQVKPEDVPEIVARSVADRQVVERLLFNGATGGNGVCASRGSGGNGNGEVVGEPAVHECDIPFYKHQQRTLLASNSRIDSRSIDDYVAIGGYAALAKALFEMTPEQVLEEVKAANLRGRGGAGFPAGSKWEGSRNAPGTPKYVIVNADEGDPGAFMDRALLEGNPHSILEGLIIGGYTIGAHEGFIYVRQEYPLAVENVTLAIRQATALGLIGSNILGSGFDFEIHVHRGAGAFVCGESTALMTALEGRVGEPRPKYVRSNVRGLWNKPSVLNNVETWANVPLIINRGAAWFTRSGTATSKGTKIFSLVGKINNTGLVEVPMGMPLRRIIEEIGGGIPGGKRFKAVQTGGPSGGCIPAELLDLPVGFDELAEAGSMMGSGGMIVMDEETCMVDVARYFIHFLTEESCGKCVPCREGLRQMDRILSRICAGEGREGDIETLETLSEVAGEASLCALGKSAPNPFLSTLRYFREEYEAHIRDKRCPALACKGLVSYYIEPEKCSACMICLNACPAGSIDGGKNRVHIIDQTQCTTCGACYEVCPPRFGAIKKISGEPVPPPIGESERTVVRKSKAR